ASLLHSVIATTPAHCRVLYRHYFVSLQATPFLFFVFFFNDPAPTEISTLSLHDALPIYGAVGLASLIDGAARNACGMRGLLADRSEEHTSELQSLTNIVCRLLLEKKKKSQDHGEALKDTHHDMELLAQDATFS